MAGCSSVPKGDDINYIDIKSENVDMSGYDGMKSIDHHFMLISPDEFFRVAEEDGSGAFYFGHTGCPSCQHVVKWIEEAATNCDKTVYYIDGYSTVYPLDKEKHLKVNQEITNGNYIKLARRINHHCANCRFVKYF